MRQRIVVPVSLHTRQAVPPLPQGELNAEKIPDAPRPKPVPLIRLAMPVIMVVAVLGMVALMVLGGGQRQLNPMMLMFPMMMLTSVFMMFGQQSGGKDPDEVRRLYLRHLRALSKQARDHGAAQRAHELHRHPGPEFLVSVISSRRLWERSAQDVDVLECRVGVGEVSLCTPIEVAPSGAPEDLDPVCAVSLRHTIHAVGQLPDMPVTIQLQAFRFLALGGDRARDLARSMVMQLAVAHGPETVGFSALGEDWEWLKWLPHAKEPGAARFHVLIVDSLTTTGLEDFVDDESISNILDVGALRTTALGIRAEQEGLFFLVGDDLRVLTQAGDESLGVPDLMSRAQATTLARKLTPCVRPAGTVVSRARDGDLLELLGVRDIDGLAENFWPGRHGAARLNVPVGVDSHGLAVNLDIKEAAQGGDGPHGLCIGATGSGKSELLKTLVTSLAATHSPEELNLVLVDFKGGATFLGCETLPHTSAVITNLEEESILVDRMYDAISGELNRRQEVLRKAGKFANVDEYNEAARRTAHPDMPPLPALVIIIDEFSELLAQHSDFADLFVAVGRLGRSLHVHLLLASQRLDEGRLRGLDSHLSYRFGLKTFSASESRQVLGIADAYTLPSKPGLGFLKTSSDECVRLQASYVSGPLRRIVGGGIIREHTTMVEPFEGWAVAEEAAPEETVFDNTTTVLESVVDLARAAATERGLAAHRIWLPPLPAVIELPDVTPSDPDPLTACIGVVDRPYQQRQDSLKIDFARSGGHLAICGGPQSGKSTLLRTVVCALAAGHAPGTASGEVCVYIIDLGGGQLATLSRLPHVAGVAGRNEPERVRRVVDTLMERLASGIGSEGADTFLVVDGWHHIGTAGADFEDLAEPLTQLAADGPSAKIHLVISTARWTTMRPAIRDLIGHRLELQLGEVMDSLIDRHAQEKLPSLPGRGLNAKGEPMLVARSSNQDLAYLCHQWEDRAPVPPLRVLPNTLALAGLTTHEGAIPLGIGGRRLEQVDWVPRQAPHFVCIGSAGSGKSMTLRTVMEGISALGPDRARMVVIDHRRRHLGALDDSMVAAYSGQSQATEESLRHLANTMRERLPGSDITPRDLANRSWWSGPDIYLVIDDLELVSDVSLAPVIEFLPHAADIGLHVVVARKSGGISRALFSGFLASLREQQPCSLLLDADKEDGPIFGMKASAQPPGRGQLLVRGENIGPIHVATLEETHD